jgi:hypothetical protein
VRKTSAATRQRCGNLHQLRRVKTGFIFNLSYNHSHFQRAFASILSHNMAIIHVQIICVTTRLII